MESKREAVWKMQKAALEVTPKSMHFPRAANENSECERKLRGVRRQKLHVTPTAIEKKKEISSHLLHWPHIFFNF